MAEEPCYGTSARALPRGAGDEPRYIRITDFGDDGILPGHEFAKPEKWAKRHVLAEGDVLFARSGATVGKTYLHSSTLDPAVFAGYCIRFRFRDEVEAAFVYGFTKTATYRSWVQTIQRPAGQPNINKEEFKSLEIPVPPIPRQRQLVEGLAAAREARDRGLESAGRLTAGFASWVVEALGLEVRGGKDSTVFAVAREALAERLDPFFHSPRFLEVERLVRSGSHARLETVVAFSKETWNPAEHANATFGYIEIHNVDRASGKVVVSEVSVEEAPSRARMAVQAGDIVVSKTRPHHGSIALLTTIHEGCVASTGFSVVRDVDESRIGREFLWVMLRLELCLQQMLRRSSGGNYPAITEEELGHIVVPTPSLDVQERIVVEARKRRSEAESLQEGARGAWENALQTFEGALLDEDVGR